MRSFWMIKADIWDVSILCTILQKKGSSVKNTDIWQPMILWQGYITDCASLKKQNCSWKITHRSSIILSVRIFVSLRWLMIYLVRKPGTGSCVRLQTVSGMRMIITVYMAEFRETVLQSVCLHAILVRIVILCVAGVRFGLKGSIILL